MLKATHQQTRDHNQRLVFKTIFDTDAISRADVARLTGLTRTTVSQAVNELLEQNLVQEVGQGTSKGGKMPILLSVPPDSRNLIGIDLGSNEFQGAIVNLRGEVRHRVSMPLGERQGEDALRLAYKLIDTLKARSSSPLLGIGIGVPGVVNPDKGTSVHWAVNLNWSNLPLHDLLAERYRVPVYVANDSQVAALAEFFFGRTRNSNLVVISVGRGIGSGIVIDGHLWQGDGFGAGEIGHVAVVRNGQRCSCGHYGCLETVAGLGGVVQRARSAARDEPHSALHRRDKSLDEVNFDDVVAAAQAGDAVTQSVVLDTGYYLGIAIANLVASLNIKHVVIAGPVSRLGELLLEQVRKTVRASALAVLANATRIEFSAVGDDIVILGASAQLLNYELGINARR